MTGRGRGGRTTPDIPGDPSLSSRPVPLRRAFAIQAFGSVSAVDLQTERYTSDKAAAERNASDRSRALFTADDEDMINLLEEIDSWATVDWDEDVRAPRPYDGTWGFYVFLTSYDDATLEKLEQAMVNWVQVVERHLEAREGPEDRKEELRKRFKLELIKDEEELAGASDHRVRENFRALMGGLDLLLPGRSSRPQCRYSVCLVIDAAAVDMLAGLQFQTDPRKEDRTLEDLTVKAIDANWTSQDARSSYWEGGDMYLGVGQLSINCLQEMYLVITRDACSAAMYDLHPLKGYPGW
ncbi:hypothetical protein AA0113_g10105 [Alternaria arborescens]|uniref:Uncharacterized protein n=1 Tax=Alternaria arborescens TaxID=156630 RepID=A0A4Q4QWL3_9PLEO|nr:hypothetical protein AA0111_g11037 [Alternaria arborescens]RYN24451.1 hypothetical protein AA0112_g8884 [Alternaria arborescens]RYO17511.1 hypothetical protein AA0111_g11037 [Alternaria arborescens]RYO48124.1 hypothetical protein AA0113_g10105 [Alternaria arborescens]